MKTLLTSILLLLAVPASAGKASNWLKIAANNGGYDCVKKYCKHMSSCSEAYHKFKVCGKKGLDRDKDGVPCENVCGRTIGRMERLLKQGL